MNSKEIEKLLQSNNTINDSIIIAIFQTKNNNINSNNIKSFNKGILPKNDLIKSYLLNRYKEECSDIHIILWHILHKKENITLCKVCKKYLPISQLKYNRIYCSEQCFSQDKDYWINKSKQTYFEKTGYDCPLKNPECREKGKQTLLKLYGITSNLNITETREKATKNAQSSEAIEKRKNTYKEKYNAEHPWSSKEIRIKMKNDYFNKHGVFYPTQDPDVISKMHSKYKYDNLTFDSKEELYIYIYCKDKNIYIEKEPIALLIFIKMLYIFIYQILK